jgi:hypothetical protein
MDDFPDIKGWSYRIAKLGRVTASTTVSTKFITIKKVTGFCGAKRTRTDNPSTRLSLT